MFATNAPNIITTKYMQQTTNIMIWQNYVIIIACMLCMALTVSF